MAKCSYEILLSTTEMWEYPRKALPGEERCYWHKEVEGKEPTQEMLNELKERAIFGAYLKKAKLQNKDLIGVKMRNANLKMAELQN
ncbi:MAG: pentapeptide repeat-containing protein [Methanomicrobia archaeon]|nr:pentapeptide repeat-containing protein [Methanomicrobia archaeon]